MRDPFPLRRSEIAASEGSRSGGPRAARMAVGPRCRAARRLVARQVPRRRRARHRCCPPADVSQISGTTATSFDFSVAYNSSQPVRNALSVWAEVGSVTVPLTLASGNTHAGTWTGSSTLPVGSWQVTFHATIAADPQPEPFIGPVVTVTQAPTPTPDTDAATDPGPDPQADSRADANGVGSVTAARRDAASEPAGSSADTAGEQSTMTARPPRRTRRQHPVPPRIPCLRARLARRRPARPTVTRLRPGRRSHQPPRPPTPRTFRRGSLLAPLLFVGGTMSMVGAAVLGRQSVRHPQDVGDAPGGHVRTS